MAYAAEGARGVVFADLNMSAAQAAADSSKTMATNPEYRAMAIWVDVSDPESVSTMVRQTVAGFGTIDYSVNSAGVRAGPSCNCFRHADMRRLRLGCGSLAGLPKRRWTSLIGSGK